MQKIKNKVNYKTLSSYDSTENDTCVIAKTAFKAPNINSKSIGISKKQAALLYVAAMLVGD